MKSWSESKICFPNGPRHNILPELKIIDLIISHNELYRIYPYGFYITKYSLRCTIHKTVIYLIRMTIYRWTSHHQVFQFSGPLNSTRNCCHIWLDWRTLWIQCSYYSIINLLLSAMSSLFHMRCFLKWVSKKVTLSTFFYKLNNFIN